MTLKKNTPTMKDVAREAGVALGTVSKVFNGIPVGESYRQKVIDAAEALGYQVNNYARGLRTNQTFNVALILPNLTHPFYGALADYTCRALRKRGYRAILNTTSFDPQLEQECVQMVVQNKVDGIIALTYNPELEISTKVPFVSIDRYYRNSTVPCICSDNFGGGQLAAETLTRLGCRKLLIFQESSNIPGEVDKRKMGFETYCNMNHISYDSLYLYDEPWDKFYQKLEESFCDGHREYDGIFCGTDHLACSMVRHLRKLGVDVPGEVQVIGYDGIRTFGMDVPFCSSIEQPVQQMAEAAVDTLLTEDHSKQQALICLPVTYLYGGTTKTLPKEEK